MRGDKDADRYLGHLSVRQFCEVLEKTASLQDGVVSVEDNKRKSNQRIMTALP